MSDLLIRLGVLVFVTLFIVLCVTLGRLFVARQRQLALSAAPLPVSETDSERPRILAFSSVDCTQCHTLQLPALQRLSELRGSEIDVIEIDAPSSPELVSRYRILTVPSTVILNAPGKVHAVNYGFANFGKLRQQVDELLGPRTEIASS